MKIQIFSFNTRNRFKSNHSTILTNFKLIAMVVAEKHAVDGNDLTRQEEVQILNHAFSESKYFSKLHKVPIFV